MGCGTSDMGTALPPALWIIDWALSSPASPPPLPPAFSLFGFHMSPPAQKKLSRHANDQPA